MGFFKHKVNILKAITSVACLMLFITFVRFQYDTYAKEPTRINFNEQTLFDLPFPAVTICDEKYEYRRAHYELGFPRNPFREPKLTYSNPQKLLYILTLDNKDIVSNMWKYYFNLDKMLERVTGDVGRLCRVGNSKCSIKKDSKFNGAPTDLSKQEVEVEVEAGKWVSRILADSKLGNIFMCHTLIPNVTVSFSQTDGDSIGISLAEEYYSVSKTRQIYIHDRDEHVLLDSFAVSTNPSFVAESTEIDVDGEKRHIIPFKRLQILPTKHVHPTTSDVHPCSNETDYSENWCKINHSWNSKINMMDQFYGDNFTCVSPGIWDFVGKAFPVCQHYAAEDVANKTLGLNDVIYPLADSIDGGPKVPSFKAPPLGVYIDNDMNTCIQRCSKYSYELKEETATESQGLDNSYDIYLYFPSPNVQVWTEYRLMSRVDFFAGIGGTLGLVLGMSILSLIFIALDMTKEVAKRMIRINKKNEMRRRKGKNIGKIGL